MENVEVNITQVSLPILNVQVVQNRVPVMTAEIVIGVNGGGGQSITFGDTMTGTGTPTDPVNVSEDILQDINNANELAEENAREISNVRNLIPATATPDNQLADQGFVNSSIQTATAYFRGDWSTWADVPSDPSLYPADATGNHTPITNDYMVVIADEQENGGTWRYKYTGVWSEQGKSGWMPEYQVNETPLTAAQLAALNSGITADAVASFVKNTDYASWSKAGIIQVSESLGTTANGYGYLQAITGTLTNYNSAGNHYFIGKGTLENIKYDLVRRSITTNDITLTDEEKAAAQSWLGIGSGGGGASLPDQTGNAGKFLMTDGSAPKWVGYFGTTGGASGTSLVLDLAGVMTVDYTAKSLVAIAPQANSSGLWSVNILGGSCSSNAISIGFGSSASREYAVGINGAATGAWSIAIGYLSTASAYGAVQLGVGTNATKNTLQFKDYQVVDASGNVPLERLTYVTNQIGDISTALTAILGE